MPPCPSSGGRVHYFHVFPLGSTPVNYDRCGRRQSVVICIKQTVNWCADFYADLSLLPCLPHTAAADNDHLHEFPRAAVAQAEEGCRSRVGVKWWEAEEWRWKTSLSGFPCLYVYFGVLLQKIVMETPKIWNLTCEKSFLYGRSRWFLTYAKKCVSAQNGRRKHICRVRFDMANIELRWRLFTLAAPFWVYHNAWQHGW